MIVLISKLIRSTFSNWSTCWWTSFEGASRKYKILRSVGGCVWINKVFEIAYLSESYLSEGTVRVPVWRPSNLTGGSEPKWGRAGSGRKVLPVKRDVKENLADSDAIPNPRFWINGSNNHWNKWPLRGSVFLAPWPPCWHCVIFFKRETQCRQPIRFTLGNWSTCWWTSFEGASRKYKILRSVRGCIWINKVFKIVYLSESYLSESTVRGPVWGPGNLMMGASRDVLGNWNWSTFVTIAAIDQKYGIWDGIRMR